MDEFELADRFTQPIVDEEDLNNNDIDENLFMALISERNFNNLCAWPKCPNEIDFGRNDNPPIYCCEECEAACVRYLDKRFSTQQEIIKDIIEKSPTMLPPKPLKFQNHYDEIEGLRVRVGPYRNNLAEITKWFKKEPKTNISSLTIPQDIVLKEVNSILATLGADMKMTPKLMDFFGNIDISDSKKFVEFPDVVKKAFAFACVDLLYHTGLQSSLPQYEIPYTLYDGITSIITRRPELYDYPYSD